MSLIEHGRRLGTHNSVRGRPGWFYGIRVTQPDGSVVFDVQDERGCRIVNLRASRYRTTTLARKMGDKRRGWEHVARDSIASFTPTGAVKSD